MRQLIESLKRLYKSGRVTEEKIRNMELDGKITIEELMWILGE